MKKTTGERIREARKVKGWSQFKLGEALGVSQQMIAQFENSKKSPKVETLERIAAALEIPVTDLLFEKGTTVAQISDGYSNIYIDPREVGKDTRAILDSSPVIAKMTPQEIEEVFNVCHAIDQAIADKIPEPEIMKQYKKLNPAGKKKAVEYTTDLAQMPKYQSDPDSDK